MPECFIQVWSEGYAGIFPHEEHGSDEQDHRGEPRRAQEAGGIFC
jgi:hypothetical protein